MHDLKAVRDDPRAFDAALKRRGLPVQADTILELDRKHRAVIQRLQELQARRNDVSKQIGQKKARGESADDLVAETGRIKAELPVLESQEREAGKAVQDLLAGLPNIPQADVPEGGDSADNVEVRRVGTPPQFDFKVKDHVAIGEGLGGMDIATAARMSGARFTLLKGQVARLERALAQFMLDLHTGEFGYTEISPPLMVRDNAAYGTGNLPKFGEDLFRTNTGHWLIPTAEVPMTNIAAEQIIDEDRLPWRFTAFTPCFRSEAGAAGKDTHGMLRQHQFYKVELVSIAHPDRSAEEHERMTACAEEVLKRLGLAYRTVVLCTGDMGFASQKTYDIEVWLPGQETYREISSCSNCGEFQARRMQARFRPKTGKGTRFVHTLNGSGLAVGRTLIAVLENCQRRDGSVELPKALVAYMGGIEVLRPHV
ncbi:MAG: serine--tRNA ligase [Alphaproteobacteria bacterium]|nr:serine--tRNA ligase [Alphaproteobacteria bacterium]